MYIFGAILYIAIKKPFPYIHMEFVLGPKVSSFKPTSLLSMDNLKALNRYHDEVQSNPNIVPLFVHFNLWWYTQGSGTKKYCIIANFCSQTSISTKWGGTRLVKRGGGDCIGLWLYSDQTVRSPEIMADTYETTIITTLKNSIFINTAANYIKSHLCYLMFRALHLLR